MIAIYTLMTKQIILFTFCGTKCYYLLDYKTHCFEEVAQEQYFCLDLVRDLILHQHVQILKIYFCLYFILKIFIFGCASTKSRYPSYLWLNFNYWRFISALLTGWWLVSWVVLLGLSKFIKIWLCREVICSSNNYWRYISIS